MKLFNKSFFTISVVFSIILGVNYAIANDKNYIAYILAGDSYSSNTKPTLYSIDLCTNKIINTQKISSSANSVSENLLSFGTNSQYLCILLSNPTRLIIKDIRTLKDLNYYSEDILYPTAISIPKKEKIWLNGQQRNLKDIIKVIEFSNLEKLNEYIIRDPKLMFSSNNTISTSNQHLYFSLTSPGGDINIIDTDKNEIIENIYLDDRSLWPGGVVVSTDNTKLYLQAYLLKPSIQYLKVIELPTGRVLRTLDIEANPLAVSPNGYFIYALSLCNENKIIFKIIETVNYNIISTFIIGDYSEYGLYKHSNISIDGRYLVMLFTGPSTSFSNYRYKGPIYVLIFDSKKMEMNKLMLKTDNPAGVVIYEYDKVGSE